jgi:hypothetical protein
LLSVDIEGRKIFSGSKEGNALLDSRSVVAASPESLTQKEEVGD